MTVVELLDFLRQDGRPRRLGRLAERFVPPPGVFIEVDVLLGAAVVAGQAVGDSQQVCPGVALFAITATRSPRPLEHFLAQIVGQIGALDPRQEESADGPAMLVDPGCKQVAVAGVTVSSSHV